MQHVDHASARMLKTRHTAVDCKFHLNIVQYRDLLCIVSKRPSLTTQRSYGPSALKEASKSGITRVPAENEHPPVQPLLTQHHAVSQDMTSPVFLHGAAELLDLTVGSSPSRVDFASLLPGRIGVL